MAKKVPPLKRTFKGMPVKEARANILLQPSVADIKGATQESPTNCAFARFIKRTYDTPTVYVFKTRCFIQTLDETGAPMLERFVVRTYAREYVIKFDGGQKVDPGGFVLYAPKPSQTLKYKERINRRSPHKTQGTPLHPYKFSTRSGTGHCNFFGPEDQIRV
jgi:hypothetical protein